MTEEKMTEEQEKKKFNIIKTLDDWRWDISPNDVLEGYESYSFGETLTKCFDDKYEDKLTEELAEKVLLTHHLLYICNRQMDARRIFSDGAKVISNIVEKYYKNKQEFNFNDYIKNIKNEKQETDTTDTENDEQKNKDSYCLKIDGKQFASRYMLTDIACMQKTFINLADIDDGLKNCNERSIYNKTFNWKFNKFLKNFSPDNSDSTDSTCSIKKLATALYELTYQGVPVIRNSDINDNDEDMGIIGQINQKLYANVDKKVLTKKGKKLSSSYKFDNKRYNLKRVWCEVRDYLYDPVLKECFKKVIGGDSFDKLLDDVYNIELPGDVWNNNPKFAKCFWKVVKIPKNFNSSWFVRDRFDKASNNGENLKCWGGCYPHNFDITFNFVPRMCESNNCSICPIFKNENNENNKNNKNKKGKDWEKICHKKDGTYCSLALYATGVKHICNGEKDCKILNPTTTP